jgi:DNA-binding response OmpR family regulator
MQKDLALIIEDDPQLSQIYEEAVKAAGYTDIERILDGNVAVERLKKVVPALVVLDLNLPNIGGPEILSAIRAQARLRDTKIILTSADARRAGELNDLVDIVLIKPVQFSTLRDMAARLRPAG